MAYDELKATGVVTLPAGADLSAHQYKGAAINSSGQVVNHQVATTAARGVIQREVGTAAGEATEVLVRPGITKGRAGAAITQGDDLTFDADGEFITSTSTDEIVGVALEAAGAADVAFTVLYLGYAGITA